MSEYKRLTRRNNDGTSWVKCVCCDKVSTCNYTKESCCQELQDRLAELEDKIENGTLVQLPCKVGSTVYQTDGVRIYESKISEIIYYTNGIAFDKSAIGASIFLTKAEAETELAKKRGQK